MAAAAALAPIALDSAYTRTILSLIPKPSISWTDQDGEPQEGKFFLLPSYKNGRNAPSLGSLHSNVEATRNRNVLDYVANENIQRWYKKSIASKVRFQTAELCSKVR